MTQDAHIPAPRDELGVHITAPRTHHSNGLLTGGGLTALLFLVFIVAGALMTGAVFTPLWIGFIVSMLVALLGVFRVIRGAGAFGFDDIEHKHPAP